MMARVSEEGHELTPGMLVGRYQLLFRLGKGGMGEVWAAAQNVSELAFQKLIALKLLRTEELTSNAAIMFLDEARAASALEHQAIVPTVDLGRDGDILFLAMDMVRGPSLTALLQKLVLNKSSMSPAIVAYIGAQLASALDYAHERASWEGKKLELIHRDVSPHNVLLDLNGVVRLTDFGVARTTIQNHESHVGTVRGKPSYMAPEQVVGGNIDARTDLFSLGIVLYESSSLKRLFGRSNPVKSMDAVLKHRPRPLPELVPGFPEALWAIIEKALEKEPARRYQRAADLASALTEVSRTLPGAPSAARDLAQLIKLTFSDDAFEIDGRIHEALVATSAPSLPAAVPSLDEVRVGPAIGRGRTDPSTRRMRARASAPAGEVGPSAEETYVTGASARVAWPSAPDADPLSPEALEEARTRFASLTPSGAGAFPMTPAELATPVSAGATGTAIAARPGPSSGATVVLGALVAAAVLLLAAAFVVVEGRRETEVPIELGEVEPASTADVRAAVRATAKPAEAAVQKGPAAIVEAVAAEEDGVAGAAAGPGEDAAPAAKKARRAPVRDKEPAKADPTEGVLVRPPGAAPGPIGAGSAGPNDGNATRGEVLELIREVKKVDPDAAKQMYPTLNEAGEDNVRVLNELRARAKAILATRR